MNFLSDTTAPAHPSLFDAMVRANEGFAPSYGADLISQRVKARLTELFEAELEVLFTTSGTAANALALSVLSRPDDIILCHDEAHIQRDERGAPEFFTGGAKLLPLHGAHAKIDPDNLANALNEWPQDFVHTTPPRVLSISQLNESGCAYTLEELDALISQAKASGVSVHMDGARFANALSHLGCSPADMTWKRGVDVLCMGATKDGALAAEAVILFGEARERFAQLQARQKRAGHMLPKMRYVAAQFEAWLADDLWLDLARYANAAGKELSDRLCQIAGVEAAHPTQGNEVFLRLPETVKDRLQAAGAGFYAWPDGSARFVASWRTTQADIDAVVKAAAT
ncbi:beta-eliminating lyase-related protein [Maricaulaceae bacterium NA33B04]|nr:beta-eliminating lyase-related protein [Maricaulaceae bacterium NA33B04]